MDNLNNSTSLAALNDTNSLFWNQEVIVRVLHRWESRNFKKGMSLMGHELLLLDAESSAVQAFIPVSRLPRFADMLSTGKVYAIRRFMLKPAKERFRVADHNKTVVLTDQTNTRQIPDEGLNIPEHMFRPRLCMEFAAIADKEVDLYDVIGKIIHATGVDGEGEGRSSNDGVSIHIRLKDGEVMRVYLWSSVAEDVRQRWEHPDGPPAVIMLTTVNAKTFGGVVTLKSTSASRVFFDNDVSLTKEFAAWLEAGSPRMPIIASSSSAVTKVETVTLDEVHQFLQQANPETFKQAVFFVDATFIDVEDGRTWNFIKCSTCESKLEMRATSLYCVGCNKTSNVGLTKFRFEAKVRDSNRAS